CRDQVSPAFDDVDEIPLVAADRAVGLAPGLLNLERAVVDGDKPASHLVDLEQIGAVNTAQHRRVFLHPVNVEDVLGGLRAAVGHRGFQQRTSRRAVGPGNPERKTEELVLAWTDPGQIETFDDHDTGPEERPMYFGVAD